jgi:hypothetical protein
MNKETVDVYWSMNTAQDRQTLMNLFWEPPKPLMTLLPQGGKNKNGSYRVCSGSIDAWKNTYALIHPTNSTLKVKGDFDKPTIEQSNPNFWYAEPGALENRYRVTYDFSWVFFAEESVKIQQLPPFMHNTADREGGWMTSGSFDISQWFRAINLTYILWEGQDAIKVNKGDPAVYLQFLSDKKVNLKRFELTPELYSIAKEVVAFKMLSPHESLNKLYDRFIGSGRKEKVLSIIKQNLLD